MLKKYRLPIITVFAVLFIDQCIKLYIKANYPIGKFAAFLVIGAALLLPKIQAWLGA
jgi:hypothetical protein